MTISKATPGYRRGQVSASLGLFKTLRINTVAFADSFKYTRKKQTTQIAKCSLRTNWIPIWSPEPVEDACQGGQVQIPIPEPQAQ